MKRVLTLTMASAMLMLYGSASAAQITPTLLIGGNKVRQIQPTGNATYLGWSQNSTAHPNHTNAYYETLPVGSGSPFQMNADGTSAYHPSFDGDTTNAVFQQATFSSNIELYDLTTHQISSPPNGINTNDWEWWPSLSQGFIEFGRDSISNAGSPWKVMVYNPNTTNTTNLASERGSCQCIFPGQVSAEYATWTDCPNNCAVYYFRFADRTTKRIPNPGRDEQYNPSVNGSTGTFYYVRSGNACGAHAKIMRWSIGDASPTVVASLPAGYDVANRTFDYVDGSSNDNVFFDQLKCSGSFDANVYEIIAANTASPSVVRVGTSSGPGTGVTMKSPGPASKLGAAPVRWGSP